MYLHKEKIRDPLIISNLSFWSNQTDLASVEYTIPTHSFSDTEVVIQANTIGLHRSS